ncbi:MAG TPA: PstS family phosphate ABC transporter substrate-binding protein [Pirellulaceae bacterium]|nr:PstS family phosphate ABC transporter substrate-binding protein [Pirellulaceae bacterium]
MRQWPWILTGISSFALALSVGCGSDFQAKRPSTKTNGDSPAVVVSELAGKLEIDGSSTVAPISTLAENQFRVNYPKVEITVGTTGTGNGFKRFTRGETDISDASRPIKAEEFKQCQENGVEFVELPIAYDGLTFVVHPENAFVEQLTLDNIKAIFLEDKAAKRWKDVNPEWPDAPIKIFSPGTGSGTFDYFKEVLGKDASIRSDISVSENDNELVQGVAGDKNAIGFFGASYYFANADRVKAVKIVNPKSGKAIAPAKETVLSGEYAPYSRPLFIYVNVKALKKPEGKKFIEFYLKNANKLADEVKYFPLPDAVIELATSNVTELKAGSHFVTAEGKQREGAFIDLFKAENLVNTK